MIITKAKGLDLLEGFPWIHDTQVVASMYHQCIKFPFNGTEIVFPKDNSMCVNMLSISKTLVPHNRSSHKLTPFL